MLQNLDRQCALQFNIFDNVSACSLASMFFCSGNHIDAENFGNVGLIAIEHPRLPTRELVFGS